MIIKAAMWRATYFSQSLSKIEESVDSLSNTLLSKQRKPKTMVSIAMKYYLEQGRIKIFILLNLGFTIFRTGKGAGVGSLRLEGSLLSGGHYLRNFTIKKFF